MHPLTATGTHKRGLVVYVYACPPGTPGSTSHDLTRYENGELGNCYYN